MTVTYNSAASAANSSFAAIAAQINALADFSASVSAGSAAAAFTEPAADVTTGKSGGQVLTGQLVFQLNGASGAETFNFGAGTSASQIAAAVNLVSDSTGVSANAERRFGFDLRLDRLWIRRTGQHRCDQRSRDRYVRSQPLVESRHRFGHCGHASTVSKPLATPTRCRSTPARWT